MSSNKRARDKWSHKAPEAKRRFEMSLQCFINKLADSNGSNETPEEIISYFRKSFEKELKSFEGDFIF
jgi:hypothetical protein